MNRASLAGVLETLGFDLMLQVRIDRKLNRSSYGKADGMIEYPHSYFRLFLLRQDGSVETFS